LTILAIAAIKGHEFFVKRLLDMKADPMKQDKNGNNVFACCLRYTISVYADEATGFAWQYNTLSFLLYSNPLLLNSIYCDRYKVRRNMMDYLNHMIKEGNRLRGESLNTSVNRIIYTKETLTDMMNKATVEYKRHTEVKHLFNDYAVKNMKKMNITSCMQLSSILPIDIVYLIIKFF
jgi:hypothetical protein